MIELEDIHKELDTLDEKLNAYEFAIKKENPKSNIPNTIRPPAPPPLDKPLAHSRSDEASLMSDGLRSSPDKDFEPDLDEESLTSDYNGRSEDDDSDLSDDRDDSKESVGRPETFDLAPDSAYPTILRDKIRAQYVNNGPKPDKKILDQLAAFKHEFTKALMERYLAPD